MQHNVAMEALVLFLLVVGVGVLVSKGRKAVLKPQEPDILQMLEEASAHEREQERERERAEEQTGESMAQFMYGQAQRAMEQLNDSLALSNNSTKPETKVSRLEFARSKLAELQAIAAQYPAITLTNEDGVKRTIERLASEFAAAGYYAQADVSCRSYTSPYVEQARLNTDVVDGMLFSATMQLRTPLRILEMHGRKHDLDAGDPPKVAMHEGVWMPALKDQMALYGTTASDIGPIPSDGGDYLRFLKAVRRIVEGDGMTEARRAALGLELVKPEWAEFCKRLGGKDAIYSRFFPAFIDTIPKLAGESVGVLWEKGWTTPAKLAAVADKELLAVKGIGPAKLKIIRQACDEAADKDAELVDCVER